MYVYMCRPDLTGWICAPAPLSKIPSQVEASLALGRFIIVRESELPLSNGIIKAAASVETGGREHLRPYGLQKADEMGRIGSCSSETMELVHT